jgi:hypothetical protein
MQSVLKLSLSSRGIDDERQNYHQQLEIPIIPKLASNPGDHIVTNSEKRIMRTKWINSM